MKKVGDTVYLKRHPGVPFIVIAVGTSPVRKETVYTVRFADRPEDTRGSLVWEDMVTW